MDCHLFPVVTPFYGTDAIVNCILDNTCHVFAKHHRLMVQSQVTTKSATIPSLFQSLVLHMAVENEGDDCDISIKLGLNNLHDGCVAARLTHLCFFQYN